MGFKTYAHLIFSCDKCSTQITNFNFLETLSILFIGWRVKLKWNLISESSIVFHYSKNEQNQQFLINTIENMGPIFLYNLPKIVGSK